MTEDEVKILLRKRTAMIYHCHSPKSKLFADYSARGLEVYQRWRDSIQSFLDWCVESGYQKNYYLNRLDKSLGFNPDNCFWSPYGPSAVDLTGKVFGKLTALKCTGESVGENLLWVCICSCGNTVTVMSGSLRSGNTKSCGCFRDDQREASEFFDGRSSDPLYKRWRGMLQRCYNPKTTWFKYYGGRGITVCDEWRDSKKGIKAFSLWAQANGYCKELEIDRIDVNGPYSPENCRWVTKEENGNNKRNNLYLEYEGQTYSVAQFARKLDVTYYAVLHRFEQGKSGAVIFKEMDDFRRRKRPILLDGIAMTTKELISKFPGLDNSFISYYKTRGRTAEEIISLARSKGRIT